MAPISKHKSQQHHDSTRTWRTASNSWLLKQSPNKAKWGISRNFFPNQQSKATAFLRSRKLWRCRREKQSRRYGTYITATICTASDSHRIINRTFTILRIQAGRYARPRFFLWGQGNHRHNVETPSKRKGSFRIFPYSSSAKISQELWFWHQRDWRGWLPHEFVSEQRRVKKIHVREFHAQGRRWP